MRAGPKNAADQSELDLSELPTDPAERRMSFVEYFLKVPSGSGAREPFRFRPFQEDIVRGLYAPGVRSGLISMPRGNGKSQLAAVLAVASLYLDGEQAQVLCLASTEQQAMHVYRAAARMIELAPELKRHTALYRDKAHYVATDSFLSPLPSLPSAIQGYAPSTAIVDELHVVDPETWEAMALAGGKRDQSLVLAISTAAGDREGAMWNLTEYGRDNEDPSFYFKEFSAPQSAPLEDPETWRMANPAMGDFLHQDAIKSNLKDTRESQFRRFRLNQWVSTEKSWITGAEWDACKKDRKIKPGSKVVLGFDGSVSNDSTALVMVDVSSLHAELVGVWEKPTNLAANDQSWRVPRGEVEATIDKLFREHKVQELACDPYHWRSEIDSWQRSYGERKVIEFPTASIARMAPASDRVRTLIMDRNMSHSGDKRLGEHVTNAIAVQTPAGVVLRKDERQKRRKVDAALALVIALDRAAHHRKRSGGRTAAFNAR